MNPLSRSWKQHLAELSCVLFGHDWTEHGETTDTVQNIVLEQYRKCARCELEHHDRSGYIEAYERWKATKEATS